MITDAILWAVNNVLAFLNGLLPTGSLPIPTDLGNTFATTVGLKVAPFDHWMPLVELFQFIRIFVEIYIPIQLTWSTTFWIYSKIPVVGK